MGLIIENLIYTKKNSLRELGWSKRLIIFLLKILFVGNMYVKISGGI